MLRRVRRRFGLTAPRVTVRAHIPWPWRALVAVFLLAFAIVVTSWVFDTGRRFAGFDKSKADQELNALRERVATLEAEHSRSSGSGSEASLEIERTAQQHLGEQIKVLEVENARMREDLATFENLASGAVKSEVASIHRLQVETDPNIAGTYHYRMLISAPATQADHEFRGRLQMVAALLQAGKTVMVNIPDSATSDPQKFMLSFKYFRRVEGDFILPAGAVLKKLEVRLMQGATIIASQQATL